MNWIAKHLASLAQQAEQKHALAFMGHGSWDDLEESVVELLRWTNAVAGSKVRYQAIREQTRVPDQLHLHALLQENEWLQDQDKALLAYIRSRASLAANAEKVFMEERGQYLDHESLIRAANYRFTMFYRNIVVDILNLGAFTQATDPEVRGLLPFASYVTMKDERVRKTHAAMHGFTALTQDPIWKLVRPPCGFNCRCTVRLYTYREALAMGWIRHGKPVFSQKWPNSTARRNYASGAFPDSGWHHPKFVAKL